MHVLISCWFSFLNIQIQVFHWHNSSNLHKHIGKHILTNLQLVWAFNFHYLVESYSFIKQYWHTINTRLRSDKLFIDFTTYYENIWQPCLLYWFSIILHSFMHIYILSFRIFIRFFFKCPPNFREPSLECYSKGTKSVNEHNVNKAKRKG